MSRRTSQLESEGANIKSTKGKKVKRKRNIQALVTTLIFTAVFLFMIGYYLYFMLHDAETVVMNSKNPRIEEKAKTVVRGTIYSSDGKKLAYTDTNGTPDNFDDDKRRYPYGKTFAQVVGYTTKGFTGLEDVCNYDLISTDTNVLKQLEQDLNHDALHGNDVHTTLNTALQKTAYEALGENRGGVIAMDPDTGDIFVSASKPSYNPEDLDEIWKELNQKSSAPLMNRSTQGQYLPGSVFKIVTTLAYMRQNEDYQDFSYHCGGTAKFKNFSLSCYHKNAHGTENLENAFAYSCNGAFATMGLDIDTDIFNRTAQDLLFNNPLPLDDLKTQNASYVKSGVFSLDEKSEKYNSYYVAESSIGQQDVLVSPAQMVMIASAIAKNGVLMKPRLIASVKTQDGDVVSEAETGEEKQLMTKKEAKQLREYMSAVCEYGTAKEFSQSSYTAYGKTGTADLTNNPDGKINSWFVGYAKKGKKRLAIAVVLENVDNGSVSAKNCAKDVFDAYFE